MALAIDVRRATDRFHTDIGWLDSWHSFSFAGHFDAENTGHGLLIVCNDDTVAPGGGFSSHAHRDMEIVTWVLAGELEHEDSEGNSGVIYPGLAQRMSAGTGIVHSEMNHSRTEPVHFVQMWVVPDQRGVAPGYEQRDRNEALAAGAWYPSPRAGSSTAPWLSTRKERRSGRPGRGPATSSSFRTRRSCTSSSRPARWTSTGNGCAPVTLPGSRPRAPSP